MLHCGSGGAQEWGDVLGGSNGLRGTGPPGGVDGVQGCVGRRVVRPKVEDSAFHGFDGTEFRVRRLAVADGFAFHAILLVRKSQGHEGGRLNVIQRTRGGLEIGALEGAEAYILQPKGCAALRFLTVGVGVLAGPTEEVERGNTEIESGRLALVGVGLSEGKKGRQDGESDWPDPFWSRVGLGEVTEEPGETFVGFSGDVLAGIWQTHCGEPLGDGIEDRRYPMRSDGLLAGLTATVVFIATVAEGKDQNDVNLGFGVRSREQGCVPEGSAVSGPFVPDGALVFDAGLEDTLVTQFRRSEQVSSEIISGVSLQTRHGSFWGYREAKWASNCESDRSQRREASSAMVLEVPGMNPTEW